MKNIYLLSSLIVLAGGFTACVSASKSTPAQADAVQTAPKAAVLPTSIDEAVASTSYRSADNVKRDQYRHPAQTLAFFGVKPEMTVVEVSPSSGWYLQILAPFLAEKGKYIGARSPAGESKYMDENAAEVSAYLKSHPEVESKTTFSEFSPPEKLEIAPAGSADMVLTFRNVHNWMQHGEAQAVFNSFFKALKPGGILGVVEHRADPKGPHDAKGMKGYVAEKDVLAFAKKAGFKLEAQSEINANPKDTKNYPEGVWTLPPVLRLGDQDEAKYIAIGESDRMTLRFVKPAAASPHAKHAKGAKKASNK